jgi:hypothetical protein
VSRLYVIREVESGDIEAVFMRKYRALMHARSLSPLTHRIESYREGLAVPSDPQVLPWPVKLTPTITLPVSPRRPYLPDPGEEE